VRKGNPLAALLLCGLVLAALAAETARARRLVGASLRLRAVEITSMHAAQLGQRPEPLLLANLALLREAQRMDPAEIGVRVARGSVYFLLGRFDEAVAGYEDALRLEPRPEIYFNIGRARLAQGDRLAAETAFARAIRLDPRLERELPR
jgi:tetratricopeptide (TPR) repeat protein